MHHTCFLGSTSTNRLAKEPPCGTIAAQPYHRRPYCATQHEKRRLQNGAIAGWKRGAASLHTSLCTLPDFAPDRLTHTNASAENPSKRRTTSSQFARYTPNTRDDSSCQSQTHIRSQPSLARKEGGSTRGRFLATSQICCIRPRRRESPMRRRTTDSLKGQVHFA